MATKTVAERGKGGKFLPGHTRLGGRQKGQANHVTRELRDMILEALDRKGGADYLEAQADANPAAFMALLGRILPRQIEGQLEGDVVIRVMTGVPRPKVDEVAES